jgi:hypothetical protein
MGYNARNDEIRDNIPRMTTRLTRFALAVVVCLLRRAQQAHKINVPPIISGYVGSTTLSVLKNPAPRSMAVAWHTPRASLGGFVRA